MMLPPPPTKFTTAAATLLCLAGIPAQDAKPGVRAQLLPAGAWTWQFEPIRCTVRVTNSSEHTIRVVLAPFAGRLDAVPFEIERKPDPRSKAPVPSYVQGGVIPTSGLRVEPGKSRDFELEIRDAEILATPARLRLRLPLRFGPDAPRGKPPKWAGTVHTPWLVHEIRPYPANAECLDARRKPPLRESYRKVLERFWSTQRITMNRGPFNPGPGHARVWDRVAPDCEMLLAAKGLSGPLRDRALLGLAYYEIEESFFVTGENAAEHLRTARRHLQQVRLRAQPPSGGLTPMLRMLQAYVDAGLGGDDRRAEVMAAIREEQPFFATMWWFEMRRLLAARR